MPSVKDIKTGDKFGRWEVIETGLRTQPTPTHAQGLPACRVACDCGTEKVVHASDLVRSGSKASRSCGCLRREVSTKRATSRNTIDGRKSHARYSTWSEMVARCTRQNHPEYANYGGRGISVHPDWRDSRAFLDWIDANLGPRPDEYSLDRIDNNGDYEPGNVRWADRSTQRRNQRGMVEL